MRSRSRSSGDPAHLITDARTPLSADIRYRERRYLLMMGIRLVCFLIALVMFVNHAGWLTAIPAVGAIAIPYFAVVLANGGREPDAARGFREYQPRPPERWQVGSGQPFRPDSGPPAPPRQGGDRTGPEEP